MKTLTVWLVIQIGIVGQPLIKGEDIEVADIATCIARAQEALERAAKIEGYDEFFATCSIVPAHKDPA